MRDYYWLHPLSPLARVPENRSFPVFAEDLPRGDVDDELADAQESAELRRIQSRCFEWILAHSEHPTFTLLLDYDDDIADFRSITRIADRKPPYSGPFTLEVSKGLCRVRTPRSLEIHDTEMRFEQYANWDGSFICLAPDEVKPFANYVGMEVGGTVWDIWPARVNSNPGLISRMLTRLGLRNDADRPSAES